MKVIERRSGESVREMARRAYVVSWIDGHEQSERLERAMSAISEANPDFNDDTGEVQLPWIERIPYLRDAIEDPQELHRVIHQRLEEVHRDRLLCMLSFIDPIRLGCEELGVSVSPGVAATIRRILEGKVSFNQEHYERVRDGREMLDAVVSIMWASAEQRQFATSLQAQDNSPQPEGGGR